MKYLFLSLMFCGSLWSLSKAVPVEEDLSLSPKERFALDKFRQLMLDYLPHGYMKSDIYLIKWLRAKNLNIDAAKSMLLANLRWRDENNIDTILDEDFSQIELEFPASYDGTDFTGRPVSTIDIGQWDVRKGILNGKRDKIVRYGFRLNELLVKRVRDAQEKGLNVTQTVTIFNLKGFNLIQHACVQCISVLVNFIMVYENNYPGIPHKLITINTPASFEVILRFIRPVMSKETKAALVMFGTKRHEWLRYILNMIPADQLDNHFGGLRRQEF